MKRRPKKASTTCEAWITLGRTAVHSEWQAGTRCCGAEDGARLRDEETGITSGLVDLRTVNTDHGDQQWCQDCRHAVLQQAEPVDQVPDVETSTRPVRKCPAWVGKDGRRHTERVPGSKRCGAVEGEYVAGDDVRRGDRGPSWRRWSPPRCCATRPTAISSSLAWPSSHSSSAPSGRPRAGTASVLAGSRRPASKRPASRRMQSMASLCSLRHGPLVLDRGQVLRRYATRVAGREVHELVVVTPALGRDVADFTTVCRLSLVPDAPRWLDLPDLGPGDAIGEPNRTGARDDTDPLCICCWWATRWVVWRRPMRRRRPRMPIAGAPGLLFASRQISLNLHPST